jgi:hypothetical protein
MPAPATLTEQLDTLYSTTWQKMQSVAVDQIYNARPFWWWMNSNGRRQEQTGGRFIGVQLNYATNATVRSIGRFDTINAQPIDPLTTAVYNWKYIAGAVQRGFIDDQQNSGEYEIIDRVQNALDNLILSMQQEMGGTQLFGDGSGNGGKDLEGLAKHISVTPAASTTVGGIDPSTNTWWQNKQLTATGAMDIYLLADLRRLVRVVSDGVDYPDLLLTTADIFEGYEAEVLEFYRTENRRATDVGFQNFSFKGITMFWDAQVVAGRVYAINTKYLVLKYDPRVNFAMTEWKTLPNGLDREAQIVFAGNLCSTQRRRQGVLTGVA